MYNDNMDNITEAWSYIEQWLDEKAKYCDRNALANGINEKELEGFQNEFNIKLPKDFCHSYSLHNGFVERIGLVHGGDLLPLSEIKRFYHVLIGKDSLKWDSNMFPFVAFNDTDFLCINFNDEQVHWAAVNNEDGSIDSYKTPYTSFSDFLLGLANDLKLGNGSMGESLC